MRKKFVIIVLLLFSLSWIVTPSGYAAENLLKNPGFEESGGWNIFGNTSWMRNLNSEEEKHNGSQSYKIVIKKAKEWDSVITEQIIKGVKEKVELEGSVWLKVPEDTPLVDTLVYLEVFFVASDGAELQKLQSEKYSDQAVPGWEKLSVSGSVPKGTKNIKFWLVVLPQGGSNAGTVYFDDACLEIISE